MRNNAQHTLNLWRSVVLNNLINLAEAQGRQGVFLAFGLVDRALDQCNFKLAHMRWCFWLSVEQFLEGYPPLTRHLDWTAQFGQRIYGGLDDVVRVGGALGLG
jgi:hypothetical protein